MEASKDIEAEVGECTEDPEAAGSTLKSGWPELEKDSAPSSLLVPAGRCIARHIKKTDELLKRFTVEDQILTDLQKAPGS